jgi:hypothetical protein
MLLEQMGQGLCAAEVLGIPSIVIFTMILGLEQDHTVMQES